jgi:hypothetical protein
MLKNNRGGGTKDYLQAALRGTGRVKTTTAPIMFMAGCNNKSRCFGCVSMYRKQQTLGVVEIESK